MMRRTVASPMPVPSKSAAECSRWNTPNSLSAYFMSKPAPLSRTMKVLPPFASADRNSTRGAGCFAVYLAVAEQIVEGHAQQSGVASRLEPGGNLEFHLSLRGGPLQVGHDLPRHTAQVHVLGANLRTGDPREFQQVVDQRAHSLAGGAHPLQGLPSR